MHIALFSPAWPIERYHNGIVTYVHWMRQELEAQGHRVSVFTGMGETSPVDTRVHLVRSGFADQIWRRMRRSSIRSPYEPFDWGRVLASSMLSVHRREPIDVIEMEESFGWSAEVQRATGIPVLVKLHGPAFLSLVEDELSTPIGRERVEREGVALTKATALASPAALTLSQTVERYGLKPVISEHVVNPMPVTSDALRWRIESCDPYTILFVGRFDRRKGGDLVLRAFKHLLVDRPRLRLVFVGPDSGLVLADGSRVGFQSYVDSLLTPDQAKSVDYRGRLPNGQISGLRSNARVTVIASRWENQGYAALEAMAQGCPVVASAVGGNPESVLHEVTGLLARPDDPVDLAAQIASLLDRPDAAVRMGEAAREHVLQHHSASKVADDSLAIYRRMVKNRQSR